MSENYEQKVREAWERAELEDHRVCCAGSVDPFRVALGVPICPWAMTPERAWQAAWEFTEQRLEEIRRCDLALGMIDEMLPGEQWHDPEQAVTAAYIRSKIQAVRDNLKRGLK